MDCLNKVYIFDLNYLPSVWTKYELDIYSRHEPQAHFERVGSQEVELAR